MRRLGMAAVVAAISAAVLVGLASAASAGSDAVTIKIGKDADGPFKSSFRYKLPQDETKNFYIRVKSRTGDDEAAHLQQGSNPYYLNSRYFLKNGTEITDDVKNGNDYDFTVKGNKPKLFRLRAHHNTGGPLSSCLEVLAEGGVGTSQAVIAFGVDPEICTV